MSTDLILYDCTTAPSPRRARLLLAEKAVAHQTVQVDLRNGEQFSPAYRALNPQCTVPALRLPDGQVLTDNAAIAAWAEAVYPHPALMGTTALERAAIASWQWKAEFDGLFAVAEALRNGSPAMVNRALPGPVDYPQIPELARRGVERISQFLLTLDAQLSSHEFVAGASFSVADITASVAVDFARVVKVKPDERHPHVLRWRAQLAQRPSFAP
jgi:glutathione S-transferase